jgi:hypothetical protein
MHQIGAAVTAACVSAASAAARRAARCMLPALQRWRFALARRFVRVSGVAVDGWRQALRRNAGAHALAYALCCAAAYGVSLPAR